MLAYVKEYFLKKGFMQMAIREPQVEVCYRLVKDGLYYVCFIDDTEGWLIDDRAKRIMDFLKTSLEDKFKNYTAKVDGLMVVFTGKPKETLPKLEGGFKYWLAHPIARKLMIYEDQPDTFYDVKELIEGYWKSNAALMPILSQIKPLGSRVNISLILINVIVFIVFSIIGSTTDTQFMYEHGAESVYAVLEKGEFYRMFTSMFLHFGVAHLLYNMVSLLYLGRALEGAFGSIRYTITYILSGLVASLTSVLWHQHTGEIYVVCAGASGAICGIAGALAFFMLKNRKQNKDFSFLRWAIFLALIMGQGLGNAGVDNAAHIGGFVSGFLIGIVMTYIPKMGKNIINNKEN